MWFENLAWQTPLLKDQKTPCRQNWNLYLSANLQICFLLLLPVESVKAVYLGLSCLSSWLMITPNLSWFSDTSRPWQWTPWLNSTRWTDRKRISAWLLCYRLTLDGMWHPSQSLVTPAPWGSWVMHAVRLTLTWCGWRTWILVLRIGWQEDFLLLGDEGVGGEIDIRDGINSSGKFMTFTRIKIEGVKGTLRKNYH